MKIVTVEGLKMKVVQDKNDATNFLNRIMARFDVIEFTDLRFGE